MKLFRWIRQGGWKPQAATTRESDGNGADGHDAATVPDLRAALPQIFVEFQRARRYERTLTVAVFTPEKTGALPERGTNGSANGIRSNGNGVMPLALASTLRQALRETDLVAWESATRRCVIVMPEIGIEEGRRAVDRMRNLCATRLSYAVRADVAEFPEDGWTFDELLAVAAVAPSGGRSKEPRREQAPAPDKQPDTSVPVAERRDQAEMAATE